MMMAGLLLGGGLVFAALVSMEDPKPEPEPAAALRAECSTWRKKIDLLVSGQIKDCSEFREICCHVNKCCECKAAYDSARCLAKENGKRQKGTTKNRDMPDRAP